MAYRLAVLGSGSWGTTMARVAALNLLKMPNKFHPEVRMWIYEEMIEGKKLSDLINHQNENVKYLPGIKLPSNLVASPDIDYVIEDATHLVFVIPHQFIEKTLASIKGKVKPGIVSISLIKGLFEDENGLKLVSELIKSELDIGVSVLSGANIASEIAKEQFSETTIACKDIDIGNLWKDVFQTKYFRVNVVSNCAAVEIVGALKNGVAIAAGFCEALLLGNNTKAAITRIGMVEMIKFARFFTEIEDESIFFESFGIADLIATCYAGRNRRVAEEHIKTRKSFDVLEKELLGGQKLQGPDTIKHACHIIKHRGLENEFPLFMSIYNILFEHKDPESLITILMDNM